jgi:hypothetical protein
MKYERKKKEATKLLAYSTVIWWPARSEQQHLYHPYQLSSKILAPKPLERIKDL